MELNLAVRLIEKGIDLSADPQTWADFGAGEGLFTHALSQLLPAGSTLYAVDKNETALKSLPLMSKSVLQTLRADFTGDLNFPSLLNGIILANSLHYVKDQVPFLVRLRHRLTPGGRIIFVEYDKLKANQWVPYPVSFENLKSLIKKSGFQRLEKLDETPSRFNRSMIYSAVAFQAVS